MYPQYNCLDVPTWIIGPALDEGLLIDRPADVLKVWPTREPIQRLPPAQFNPAKNAQRSKIESAKISVIFNA